MAISEVQHGDYFWFDNQEFVKLGGSYFNMKTMEPVGFHSDVNVVQIGRVKFRPDKSRTWSKSIINQIDQAKLKYIKGSSRESIAVLLDVIRLITNEGVE